MTKEIINIKYNGKTYVIPKPFNQCYFGDEPTKMMTIGNRFNDESGQGQFAKLPAFAVAIYDTIIGCEATEDYDTMQKGLTWFQKYFTDEYYTLLD
tara:strand:+ start:222 stop:509 length:288 start_codon:yes stop_codon:yes gene_type:complete